MMDETASAGRPWTRAYPQAVAWDAPVPTLSLPALFDEAAERFADRPFLDFLDRRWSYRRSAEVIARAAKGFHDLLGVGTGVRVGLFLPNTPYFVWSYFAILKAGGTVVNFNPLYAERELIHQIEDSGIKIIVTLDVARLYDRVSGLVGVTGLRTIVVCPLAGVLPFPKNLLFSLLKRSERARLDGDGRVRRWRDLIANDGVMAPPAIDPARDVAVLQYTGGTTGVPKGAMLTHANLTANAIQCGHWYVGVEPGAERVLGVLPLFHVFAMTVVMNLGVRVGAAIILLPRFEIDQVLRTIHRKRPTFFPAVPTIYTAINHHPRRAEFDLSSIRFCISGGAPLPAEVRQTFERLTGCRLVEGYGLSETSPVATCNPPDGTGRPGTIGLPLPGTVIEIVSLDEPRVALGPGQRGEVCVRGPQVMKGYWNRARETAEVLVEGRLFTGDIGVMDEDGYVAIVDRIKDLILCGGFNVYPRNVEEAIYQHPAVAECVVAGIPDAYRGQTVKAYLRLADGCRLGSDDLRAFLADKLSPMEMPRVVEFRDELPKTLVGKLSRKALLEEEEARGPHEG